MLGLLKRSVPVVLVSAFSMLPVLAQTPSAPNPQAKLIEKINSLHWIHGPSLVHLGEQTTVNIPAGIRYLDSIDTKQFMLLNGNPAPDGSYIISPEHVTWFALFDFDSSGYVTDKENIDPTSLLDKLKENQTAANERRKSLGLEPIYIDKWSVEPHYDPGSHNLEWGTLMHGGNGAPLINYTSRILGRDGVTGVTLVTDPRDFSSDLAQFRAATATLKYVPQKRYEDFKKGDKVAAYGLGALIAGGAAAAVVKSGIFAGLFAIIAKASIAFFKVIAVGVIALIAAIGSWFRRLFNKPSDQ